MKRFVVVVLLFFAACSQVPVSAPDKAMHIEPLNFGTSDHDAAFALAKHRSGVYVAGVTNGNLHSRQKGDGDAFLRKYDKSGKVIWGRQFGTSQTDFVVGVASDSANNAYVAGWTYGSLAGSKGGDDSFVRKYSPSGVVLWTRQFGTKNGDYASSIGVSGSSVYVVGTISNYETGDYDAFIQKLGADGTSRWRKVFGTRYPDGAFDVVTDGRGKVYVVGSGALVATDPDGYDTLFIRKYTSGGGVVWTKQFRGEASAVAVDGSSVYVAGSGEYHQPPNINDARIVKLSTSGSKLWDKHFDLGGDEYLFDISAYNQQVVIAGSTSPNQPNNYDSDGYVVKLTPNGSRVWTKRLATPESDETRAVLATSTGVYAAGYTEGKLGGRNHGSGDAYLARLRSSDGSRLWLHQ